MDSLENKILGIFEEFKVKRNGILLFQSLQGRTLKYTQKEQDKSSESIQSLINKGYLEKKNTGLVLASAGFDYLYSKITVEVTEEQIMDLFRRNSRKVSDILMPQHLMSSGFYEHPKHRENLEKALENLAKKSFIEITNKAYRLLQAGYDHIY
jgi:predicted transcriptional regulator